MTKQIIEMTFGGHEITQLVKFFDCRKYAESLLRDGELYMRPIRSFAAAEAKDFGDGRMDPYEAMSSRIMVESPGKPIYCCTAIAPSGLSDFLRSRDGVRVVSEMVGANGAAVVINNPAEFLARLYERVPEGFRYGLITYGGDILGVKDALLYPGVKAFLKGNKFAYQHEFRIALNIDQPLKLQPVGEHDGIPVCRQFFEPRTVTVGSLEDIAYMMEVEDLHFAQMR